MKKRIQILAYLLLILFLLHPGISRPVLAKEGHAKATPKERSRNPKPRDAKAARKVAQEPQKFSDTSENISKIATVNFAEMARREALAPATPSQKLRIVPEPEDEGEEEGARKRQVPPDAVFFRDESGATSIPQPLGPSPVVSASFRGSPLTDTAPPDTQGAAGPNHLVVAVNGGMLIQSKTGTTLVSLQLVNFFAGASINHDVFDPRVQYDPYGNRWILIADADRMSAVSAVLVAVSQTTDPTGNWNIYRIDTDPADQFWADFPVLGFNKDWIVISTNMFPLQGDVPSQAHSRLYILGKANAYAGIQTNLTRRSARNSDGPTIVPTSTYDPNLSTMYLLQDFGGNPNGSGYLRLYTITGAIGSEVFNNLSPMTLISTPNPWDDAPPGGDDFAPQLGTFDKINVNNAWIQNVVYRNGSLWCAQTVFLPTGGPTRSSVQWWQINPASASIQQRGRIDDLSGNVFYAFPSIAVNKNNDVLIGYSRFSASQYAGAGYAYRASTDPLNTLRDDTTLKVGEGIYSNRFGTKPINRWGDYSSATVDPSNDTDMWTLQEYAASFNQWSTWWGRINAGSPPNDNFINAQLISGSAGSVSGSNINASKETVEPMHAGNSGGTSVWYQWQAPASGTATITTAGSNFDTLLAVYTGSSVNALTPIASNDDVSAGDVTSSVVFNVTGGTIYRIAIDGYSGATGSVVLNWNLANPANTSIKFSAASYSVSEGGGSATVTVTRSGNTSGGTRVNYASSDGTARQRKDYTIASGLLSFSAGEISKSFTVLVTDNAYVDGNRTINLSLSNTLGGILSAPSAAVLTVTDNDVTSPTFNPIDSAQFFVTQHYYDFLNRAPDAGGLAYWSSQITQCGTDATCINSRRISVSAAYFIELEFQDTGSFVYRFYKASYGQRPTYAQFMPDRSSVVGGANLEAGKQAFAEAWVGRPEFLAKYPVALTGTQFIDAMLQTVLLGSGVNLASQRASLINDYNANQSRARIVRLIVDDATFKALEYNRAFVLMQYFGYLRRDPDQGGYDFWLDVLNNRVPNNFRGMVCAFITSAEYQDRFSPVRTRNDTICASTP